MSSRGEPIHDLNDMSSLPSVAARGLRVLATAIISVVDFDTLRTIAY
ncbi:MAG: hypothetical protein QOE20_4223 [Mycobacterium sp.]|jgi:hypothetical protein|nr:hypothetical protein [Mycobacterium sp.]